MKLLPITPRRHFDTSAARITEEAPVTRSVRRLPVMRERPYPPWPVLGDEDVGAVTDVLRSGKLTQLTGHHVAAFEEATRHGAGVTEFEGQLVDRPVVERALRALRAWELARSQSV